MSAVQPAASNQQQWLGGCLAADDEEGEQEEEQVEKEADVFVSADIYDYVVVAAFGGLEINMSGELRKTLHPAVLWIIACLLFAVQMQSLMLLRLDMDVDQKVKEEGEDMLISLKLLMITVLQLMLFKELMGTARLLAFIINPTTWTDVKRPNATTGDASFAYYTFRPRVLFPLCLSAVMFKLSIAYVVCIDSVSLVLECRQVKEAIFNCLAITFIADLDLTAWEVAAALFNFERKKDWEFRLFDTKTRKVMVKSMPCWWQIMVQRWIPCVRRGRGGRKAELTLTLIFMTFVYMRQLFVVLFALETNIMPMARDLCTEWRLMHGHSFSSDHMSEASEAMFRGISLSSSEDFLDRVVKDKLHHHCAIDGKYRRMGIPDMLDQVKEKPWQCGVVLGLICGTLILPQFLMWTLTSKACKECLYDSSTSPRSYSVQEQAELLSDAGETAEQKEIRSLREELKSMQQRLEVLDSKQR